MCMGGGGSSGGGKVDNSFTVEPVPPNVIDKDDRWNFPDAKVPKKNDLKIPTNVNTSDKTGLQI